MKVLNFAQDKTQRKFGIYIIAGVSGILLFILFAGLYRILSYLVKFIYSYWLWIIGFILGFLILKKFFGKKKIVQVVQK